MCCSVKVDQEEPRCCSVFEDPVDAIALNVPDYYNVITNPMDISTMEKKLTTGEYKTVADFEADFRLLPWQMLSATMARNL